MSAAATHPHTQLLVYGFGPGASFEGRLVGMLERVESGGALRIREALFVGRDPETGELVAVDLRGGRAGGMVAPLLDFRLDRDKRRRATEKALGGTGGLSEENLRELEARLEPGGTLVAVLVEHTWARSLEDAVARTGGTPLASEFVEAESLAQLEPKLLEAATRGFAEGGER